MNVICQNRLYESRTNLSTIDTINNLLQGEINVLTSNLDITNSNLDYLQQDFLITSNSVYTDIAPLTWLINTELQTNIFPPSTEIIYSINTYIYNNDEYGEIRFKNI